MKMLWTIIKDTFCVVGWYLEFFGLLGQLVIFASVFLLFTAYKFIGAIILSLILAKVTHILCNVIENTFMESNEEEAGRKARSWMFIIGILATIGLICFIRWANP